MHGDHDGACFQISAAGKADLFRFFPEKGSDALLDAAHGE